MFRKLLSETQHQATQIARKVKITDSNLANQYIKSYLDHSGNLSAIDFFNTTSPLKYPNLSFKLLREQLNKVRHIQSMAATAKNSSIPLLEKRLTAQKSELAKIVPGFGFFNILPTKSLNQLSKIYSQTSFGYQDFSSKDIEMLLGTSAYDHQNKYYQEIFLQSRDIIKKDQPNLLVYENTLHQAKEINTLIKSIPLELESILSNSTSIGSAPIKKIQALYSTLKKQLLRPWMNSRFGRELKPFISELVQILDTILFVLTVNKRKKPQDIVASIAFPNGSTHLLEADILKYKIQSFEYQYQQQVNNYSLKQQTILLAQQKILKFLLQNYINNFKHLSQTIEPDTLVSLIRLLNKWYFPTEPRYINQLLIKLEKISTTKDQIILKQLPALQEWLKEYIAHQEALLDPENGHPDYAIENHSSILSRVKKTRFLYWLITGENIKRKDRLEKGLALLSNILSYNTYGQQKPVRALETIANNLSDIYPKIAAKINASLNSYYKKKITETIRLLKKIKPSANSIIEGKSEYIIEYLNQLQQSLHNTISNSQEIDIATAIYTLNNIIKTLSSAEYAYSLTSPFSENQDFNTNLIHQINECINDLSVNLSRNSATETEAQSLFNNLNQNGIDSLLFQTQESSLNNENSYIPISKKVIEFIQQLRTLLPPIVFSIGVEIKKDKKNSSEEMITKDISSLYLKIGALKIPQIFFRKLLVDTSYRKMIFNKSSDVSTAIRDNIITDLNKHESAEMVVRPVTIELPQDKQLRTFIITTD